MSTSFFPTIPNSIPANAYNTSGLDQAAPLQRFALLVIAADDPAMPFAFAAAPSLAIFGSNPTETGTGEGIGSRWLRVGGTDAATTCIAQLVSLPPGAYINDVAALPAGTTFKVNVLVGA